MQFKPYLCGNRYYESLFGVLLPYEQLPTIFPDILLVPLICFDSKLNRIGYGKGYYDNYLSNCEYLNKNITSIGISL
jgi:5-formyltetrahydrofolate cyclo-ligase